MINTLLGFPHDPMRKKSAYSYKVLPGINKLYAAFYKNGKSIHAVTVPKDNKLRMDMLKSVANAIDSVSLAEEILLPGILAI